MGEIADMMLDGTLDAITGEYIGGSCGYPRSSEPSFWMNIKQNKEFDAKGHERVKCNYCNKMITRIGMKQHFEAKHKNNIITADAGKV